MRRRSGFAGLRASREIALGMGGAARRRGAQAPGWHRKSRHADRTGRDLRRRDRGSGPGRRTAAAGLRRPALSRGHAPQISLHRSASREAAPEHHAARPYRRFDPHAHETGGLLRIPDADPDRLLTRGRARLSRALAPASGQILRAAAGAPAVQAAHHGRRLRSLFPDRALFPRRGRPRRPLAGRVLPARRRNELRDAGRRVRRHRAGAARLVRGVRQRQGGHAEIPAHFL